MNSEKEKKKISKFISFVLRHKPETIGMVLDNNGYANTNELIDKMKGNGFDITFEILQEVVSSNEKQRFSFDETKTKIRANQGHSILVDVELKVADPPVFLYHGTGEKNVSAILETGLDKKGRQHVHLSIDKETAISVGGRHGKPKVFRVSASQMKADGFTFYLSENGVWLTVHIPVKYIQLLPT
jgi:putative RNA 2'-phosphotransferase